MLIWLSVSPAVIKIQEQIETHDGNIKYINVTNPIEAGSYFVQYTKHITQNNNHHKHRAFSCYYFGSQTFDNGYGPPKGKT